MGTSVTLVACHVFVAGLYLPPVLAGTSPSSIPPHITILVPSHTAVCEYRAVGALVLLVARHAFVAGLYRPPLSRVRPHNQSAYPPHTIISIPVHTDV